MYLMNNLALDITNTFSNHQCKTFFSKEGGFITRSLAHALLTRYSTVDPAR